MTDRNISRQTNQSAANTSQLHKSLWIATKSVLEINFAAGVSKTNRKIFGKDVMNAKVFLLQLLPKQHRNRMINLDLSSGTVFWKVAKEKLMKLKLNHPMGSAQPRFFFGISRCSAVDLLRTKFWAFL